jgi:hypothetical protein
MFVVGPCQRLGLFTAELSDPAADQPLRVRSFNGDLLDFVCKDQIDLFLALLAAKWR